jgi:hypothetical protein
MIKSAEAFVTENHSRKVGKHRRIRQRQDGRSCLLPESEEEEPESTPRFQLDGISPTVKKVAPASPMRVLLCNAKTMKFLRSGPERWTSDPRQARDFHNGWWATIHAFTMNPRQLLIHYEFDDNRYDLQIPVLGHPRHRHLTIESA